MGNSNGKPVVFTDEVNLNHFRLLRVVGKGAFGKVRIVERKDSGLTFALKYIRKDEVVRSESVRNIIRERRMLEHLNHPFLCNLRYSFQDIEYLYIVVDLMNGGDLRFHISRKTFTEEAVRFWMAELGCALRYIHQQGIIHRDVKPDNILLDSQGHLHLADFNVASEFRPDKKLHSKSGTLAYLAPEVYGGGGYLSEVDWWSLGVVFYECIYNKGHDKLEKEIRKGTPHYPVTQPPVSMPCLHAISSLLEKDKRKRIGAAGFDTFTDNPFFRPIDFQALERKEVPPVFVPSSEKTNFDATYDLEELLLEEAPLEARARRQKPRGALKEDATEKEIRADELHRMIETLFEPFDYTAVSGYASSGVPHCPEDWEPPPAESTTTSEGKSPSRNSMRDSSSPVHLKSSTSTNSEYDLAPETRTASPAPPLPGSPSTAPRPTVAPSAPRHGGQPRSTSRGNRLTPKGARAASKSGGIQVTVGPTASWAAVDQSNATLPADSVNGVHGAEGKPHHGILTSFLSRKKGRERSPKPLENGVLGKEGARVVINSGGR